MVYLRYIYPQTKLAIKISIVRTVRRPGALGRWNPLLVLRVDSIHSGSLVFPLKPAIRLSYPRNILIALLDYSLR
jgi:hypothetical protein